MKIVVQRCGASRVEVNGEIVGAIEAGLTLFVGVEEGDTEAQAEKLARKIATLRIFDNEEGRFDRSLVDTGGGALVISNFTLCGDAKKGTRPNFSGAAKPEVANALFERFVTLLREQGIPTETGVFGAAMQVFVANDGPVTLILEA